MLQANIALMIKGNQLVSSGIGFQPAADFNRFDKIAEDWEIEEDDWHGRCWVKIKGKVYGVAHSDYTLQYPEECR